MGAWIYFPLEQARGPGDGELAYFMTQSLAHPRRLERDFLVRVGYQALRFGDRGAFRFLDDFGRALAGLLDHMRGLVTSLAHDVLGASRRPSRSF